MDEIITRINTVLKNELGVKDEEIVPTASITEDLYADSLDQVEVTMALEEEFEIDIPDDEVLQIKTVQDIYDVVTKKLGQ